MSRLARSHEDNRLKVCFGCGKSPVSKRLGPSSKTLVGSFFDRSFDWQDPRYPLGLCWPCEKALKAVNFSKPDEVTKVTESMGSMPWLGDEDFSVPSTSSGKCPAGSCKICEAAAGFAPLKGVKQYKRSNPFGTAKSKVGRPPTVSVSPGLICKDCLTEVKEGEEHKCSSANRRASLLKLAEADPKGSQMIAAKVVKNLPGSPGRGTKRLTQERGGKPVPVLPGGSAPVRSRSKRVSALQAAAIQARSGLSARKRRQVFSDVNNFHQQGSVSGRKVFKPNVEADIQKMKQEFSSFFEVTEVVINGTKTIVAHVKSQDQFIKYIKRCRQLDHGNVLNKVLADSGGDFLKQSLSIIDLFNATDPERLANAKRSDSDWTDSLGALDSGINGLFITCIGHKIEESPESIQTFFNLTKMEEIEYKIANDFKVGNICTGLMTSNSSCPCIYCNQLRKKFGKKGEERTVGGISDLYEDFDIGGRVVPSNARAKFDSVCREPILPGAARSDKILHLIPPPELHLLEGVTNHVLTKIRQELPAEFKKFLKTLNLDKEKYEKYTSKCYFEGNDCKKILDHIDNFFGFTSKGYGSLSQLLIKPHLHFLRAFSKVVHGCFGFHLEPDYADKIKLAKEAYDSLVEATAGLEPSERKVRYFYKMHVVAFHVKDFVEEFGALGPYSEQAGETVHSWWTTLWKNYRSLPKKTHAERLLSCLVEWNFRRLALILGLREEDDDDEQGLGIT